MCHFKVLFISFDDAVGQVPVEGTESKLVLILIGLSLSGGERQELDLLGVRHGVGLPVLGNGELSTGAHDTQY